MEVYKYKYTSVLIHFQFFSYNYTSPASLFNIFGYAGLRRCAAKIESGV